MVFVGDAVVEVGVGEGLRGEADLRVAVPLLEVVLPQVNCVLAEVGEAVVRGARVGGRQEVGREALGEGET